MAIDPVREKHERWMKLALIVLFCVWLVNEGWSSYHAQRSWLDISRAVFFPAIMMLSLLMDFLRTPAFILTWCFLSFGLWLEAHGFQEGIAFYNDFDHNGWLFLAGWLFYSYLAVSVVVAWLRKPPVKTLAS